MRLLLQTNLLASSPFLEASKEWYYVAPDGVRIGPVTKDVLRRAWSKGEISLETKCWAGGGGMEEWLRLKDLRELRWSVAGRGPRNAVLTPVQVGCGFRVQCLRDDPQR